MALMYVFAHPATLSPLKERSKLRGIEPREIKDEGRGIDPDDLPLIFDIFHRGKHADEKTGQGIGLATVKAIVEGHGGEVIVKSEPGKGSTFTVILPKSRG